MLHIINNIICHFKPCFYKQNHSKLQFESRTFFWFTIVIIGFMIRPDHLGVSSFIRGLLISQCAYHPLCDFFNSNVWSLQTIVMQWLSAICTYAPLYTVAGCVIMIGDHSKIAKEGFYMGCLGRHHQESETVSKGEKIQ